MFLNRLKVSAITLRKYPRIFDFLKRLSRLFDKSEIFELLKEYEQSVKKSERVNLIQIGANDGISNDPIREFIIKNKNWYVYLYEPIPDCADSLRRNYRAILGKRAFVHQVAVSDSNSIGNIFRVNDNFKEELPDFASQIASLDPQHILKHFPNYGEEILHSEEIKIEKVSVAIQDLKLSSLEILCLDVEGNEDKILEEYPFIAQRPKIVIYESIHMSSQVKRGLIDLFKKSKYHHFEFKFDSIAITHGICKNWIAKYGSRKSYS